MMPGTLRSFFVIAALWCVAAAAQAQAASAVPDSVLFRPEVERAFVEAMRQFTAGQFDSAAASFQAIIREHPRSHRETGAYIMGGKALVNAGNHREAVRMLKDLLDLYPRSSYVDDAHYTIGLAYFRMRRFEDAAAELLLVRQTSDDPRLLARAERLVDILVSSSLSLAQIQYLLPDARTDAMKALLNLRIAERVFRSGDVRSAQEILRNVASMSPTIKYVGDALTLLDQTRRSSVVKLGVALPLMLRADNAAQRGLGAEFLEGIQEAVDEHNVSALTKVALEVRDTERDPALAAQHVGELTRDEKVVAILGPVVSSEAFACAGIANERGVPLITPTATANGIAAIGPFVFQANPDFTIRGRAAAAFSFETLGARRFAVVAPSDPIGRQTAEAFIAQALALGGDTVGVQYFPAGSTDIRPQLLAIRHRSFAGMEFTTIDFGSKVKQSDINKLLRAGVDRQLVDSLLDRGLAVDVTVLLGPDGRHLADSLQLPQTIVRPKVDSLALAATGVDVLFIPIASSDDIPVVSSQVKFVNFLAQVIGSADWNDPASLDDNRRYTDGVMFTADSYYEPQGRSVREFAARLARAKRKAPTVNTLFGYDVTRVLLQVIAAGATRRTEIAAALAAVRGYAGLHSTISFGPGRVNSAMTVLQYRNRAVRKIGSVDLTAEVRKPAP